MKKAAVQNALLVLISVGLTLLGVELALRIGQGKVLHFKSSTGKPRTTPPENSAGRMEYHPDLGWIPRPGQYGNAWTSTVDSTHLRSNGRSTSATGRPILAVGDSFAFGDEVEDVETWPSQLEAILNKRVLNAGVGAYGIDQAFLRAELLLDEYEPDVVILSFISDDISRTEYALYPYAFRGGWKPYFMYEEGELNLHNVPVPRDPVSRRFQTVRWLLGYSLLADLIFDRLAPRWWRNRPVIRRVHEDGEAVSTALLVRLDRLTKARGGQFIAVALATSGRIGGNARLAGLVDRAREAGVTVLDLSPAILALPPDQRDSYFQPRGHYSPAMNRRVAEQIATFLEERDELSPTDSTQIAP